MPGTIKVSVLEFLDLPKMSPSPISIKVSMGRRHFEAWDTGEFSFPLTTLREDVILIIRDAEGNEISRAGVQAKSIVEKGFWDDVFPLEGGGGGQVHLQFQFALSDDDRNRIRVMRETALKRKHIERHDRNLEDSETNLASSFYLNPELSDSQKCLLQVEDLSVKAAAHHSPTAIPENENFGTENTTVDCLNQTQRLTVENDADNSSTSPTIQEVDNNQPKVNSTELVERVETESQNIDEFLRTIHTEENLSHSHGSKSFKSPSTNEEKALRSADAPSRGKTPSNVKKVISAFESSLTQGTKPLIRHTLRNIHSNELEKQASLKEKIATTENRLALSEATSVKVRDSKQDLADVQREAYGGSKLLSEDYLQSKSNKLKGIKSKTKGENLSQVNKFIEECKETDAKNDDESYQKLLKTKNLETDSVSERAKDDPLVTPQPFNSTPSPDPPDYRGNPVIEESKMKRVSRNSRERNILDTSANIVKSVSTSSINEQFPSKSYGGWIFPDEGRQACVTAGGIQRVDLVRDRASNTFIRQGEMNVSLEENKATSETKSNEQKMIKPDPSENVNPSEGPLVNALKIAIMIGFGTLVLFTRQRKKKK